MFCYRYLLWLLFLPIISSQAQETSFTGWSAWFHNSKVANGHSGFHLDMQARSSDEWKDIQALIFRPGYMFYTEGGSSLTAGYGFFSRRRYNARRGLRPEHRLWQQFQHTHFYSFVPLTHRLRLEERWVPMLKNTNDNQETFDFRLRLRYFLRTVIPMAGNKHTFEKGPFVGLQNEIFVGLYQNGMSAKDIYDQNRFYVSAGYRVNSKVDIEMGYMNIVSTRSDITSLQHTLQFAVYSRLPIHF
jgi:hypothetical protein